MPTSAAANAGASLIPSPIIATLTTLPFSSFLPSSQILRELTFIRSQLRKYRGWFDANLFGNRQRGRSRVAREHAHGLSSFPKGIDGILRSVRGASEYRKTVASGEEDEHRTAIASPALLCSSVARATTFSSSLELFPRRHLKPTTRSKSENFAVNFTFNTFTVLNFVVFHVQRAMTRAAVVAVTDIIDGGFSNRMHRTSFQRFRTRTLSSSLLLNAKLAMLSSLNSTFLFPRWTFHPTSKCQFCLNTRD